ncbi:MAG: hypothetical protein ABIM89_06380, partial [Mycobacteriales bacterium]
ELPVVATIVDPIPAGTVWAGGAVCTPSCTDPPAVADGRVRFAMTAAASATGTVSYAVRVAADGADGDVITAPAASIEPGRAASGTVVHRLHVAPSAGLRVLSRVDKASAPVGDVVSYAIAITNRSDGVQDGVTVSDVVPANAEYVAGSASCPGPCRARYDVPTNTVTWRLGRLPAGAQVARLTFQVRIRPLTLNPDGSLPGTLVLNSAVASSIRTPATESNEVQTVVVAVLGTKLVRQRPPAIVSGPGAPTLPATGSETGLQLTLALALLAAGTALIAGERRYYAARTSR